MNSTGTEGAPGPILLRPGAVVLPDQIYRNATLVLENGRIAHITAGSGEALRTSAPTLDLPEVTLFPGFIDVHIHGAVGVDTLQASAEDLLRLSQFLATQGVTAWLPTMVPGSPESYQNAVRAIEELMQQQADGPAETGARALGVHYEGPFVSIHQCGALRTAYFRSFNTTADLDGLPLPAAGLRMMTVAPEIDGGIDLVNELARRGWTVSIGHTRADPPVLDQAFIAGARHMTHFMNAMAPLHHRSPGPIGWGMMRDDVTCDVIADGIHLDPLMLRLLLRFKMATRLTLISDAIAAAGLGDGEYEIWDEKIQVRNGQTRNAQGGLAGSAISMLDAVRMMSSLQVAPHEIALMAAENPARLLGIHGDCGSIEEGKRADLVGLDNSGNVQLTIIGGRAAYQTPIRL